MNAHRLLGKAGTALEPPRERQLDWNASQYGIVVFIIIGQDDEAPRNHILSMLRRAVAQPLIFAVL